LASGGLILNSLFWRGHRGPEISLAGGRPPDPPWNRPWIVPGTCSKERLARIVMHCLLSHLTVGKHRFLTLHLTDFTEEEQSACIKIPSTAIFLRYRRVQSPERLTGRGRKSSAGRRPPT